MKAAKIDLLLGVLLVIFPVIQLIVFIANGCQLSVWSHIATLCSLIICATTLLIIDIFAYKDMKNKHKKDEE